MEYFVTGFFVGMILEFLVVLYVMGKNPEMEEECSDDPEKLVAELRAMRVVTGLCRKEKEILDQSADYIEKVLENDRDKHSSNE